MTYTVKTDYSPIYEFAASLTIFIDKKMVKNIELGMDWYIRVEENLSEDFKSLLEQVKELDCNTYLYLLIFLSPEKHSFSSFINWLSNLSPGEIYELLAPAVVDPLPNDLGNIRDLYVKMLIGWDMEYYQSIDPAIDLEIQNSFENISNANYDDPICFVEEVSGGVRIPAINGLEEIILIPTYHQSPIITYHRHRSFFIVFYSINLPEKDGKTPAKPLLRLTKALSDENRLRILRELTTGPKNFSSLLQVIDVSKSTVHHHIMALRSAGLISVLLSEDCGFDTYVLREKGIEELNLHLKVYLNLK